MSRRKKKTIPDGGAEPFCPHFEKCGGCTYQRFDYEGQMKIKLDMVKETLNEAYQKALGSDNDSASENQFPLFECLESPDRTEYRNKMEFSFGDSEKDGPLSLGLHERGSFYNIVSILDCRIVDADYRAILWAALQYFSEKGISYVHKKTHEGYLRHLVVRKSAATGEILISLVTSSEIKDKELLDGFVDRLLLLELYGYVSGIIHIINDSLADVVKADSMELLYGRDHIVEKLFGLSFKITPFSFFQTNYKGAEVLYSVIRENIGDISGMTVYDLYSGTGTIAQILAPVAKKVIGVEIVEEAVEAARENAKINGLDNCEFIAGDVLNVLGSIRELPDVMVLDPPREGIHPKVLPRLLDYGVKNFIYVSCNYKSFAAELPVIMAAGYRPVKAVCVDMFPWTGHVETVVLLSREKVDGYVNIDLDVEKLEGKSETAKYKEIKAYIEREHGFKVSTLYIAQIKDKVGLAK